MLTGYEHPFNSAPSPDYNYSADLYTFVNKLLDVRTPEIRGNFTSLEDSLLCSRKKVNMHESKVQQIEPCYVFPDALSY